MKFGLFGGAKSAGEGSVGDSLGYRKYIDYVLHAEQLGYHSVFVVEHHFTGVGQLSASLNFLSYLAGRTERIRLGTAVVVLPWHNPVLLAEQVATLDLLSNGRFDFGVGKGYRAAGVRRLLHPHRGGDRALRRGHGVPAQGLGPGEGRFSHHGKRWHFDNIVVEPRPVQQPHPPFWMGAGSFESIRRAAQEGFNLLLDQIAPIDLIIERVAAYRQELERLGRRYRPGMQIGVTRALQIVRTEEERQAAYALRDARCSRPSAGWHAARAPSATRTSARMPTPTSRARSPRCSGTPEEIIARLRQLEAGGVDYVLLVDPTGSKDALRTFAEEIMPAFPEVSVPSPHASVGAGPS